MSDNKPGVVAYVVCNDPEAHRELLDLCNRWHRQKSNSLYVDGERSPEGYRGEMADAEAHGRLQKDLAALMDRWRQRVARAAGGTPGQERGGITVIVSYLPAERLDDLVAATGFNLDGTDHEYKYRWLLERIGMLRERSDMANIVHDNPEVNHLVALVRQERLWSEGLSNTIAAQRAELDALRRGKT